MAFLTDKRHVSCRRDSLFHEYFIDIASAGAIDFHLVQAATWRQVLEMILVSWEGRQAQVELVH